MHPDRWVTPSMAKTARLEGVSTSYKHYCISQEDLSPDVEASHHSNYFCLSLIMSFPSEPTESSQLTLVMVSLVHWRCSSNIELQKVGAATSTSFLPRILGTPPHRASRYISQEISREKSLSQNIPAMCSSPGTVGTYLLTSTQLT